MVEGDSTRQESGSASASQQHPSSPRTPSTPHGGFPHDTLGTGSLQQQNASSPAVQISNATPPRAKTSSKTNGHPGSPSMHGNGGNSSVDLDTVLRQSGGDVRRALETVLNDRNSLAAQNASLWKLMEKQRAQTSHMAKEADRLRGERNKASALLASLGHTLAPSGLSGTGSPRMGHSNSAVNLLKEERHKSKERHRPGTAPTHEIIDTEKPGQLLRHHSDHKAPKEGDKVIRQPSKDNLLGDKSAEGLWRPLNPKSPARSQKPFESLSNGSSPDTETSGTALLPSVNIVPGSTTNAGKESLEDRAFFAPTGKSPNHLSTTGPSGSVPNPQESLKLDTTPSYPIRKSSRDGTSPCTLR